METTRYQHFSEQISCPDNPVGIDALKTHAMILAKLESIEQRLATLEQRGAPTDGAPAALSDAAALLLELGPKAVATLVDMLDAEVANAAARGQDVDLAVRNGLTAALYFGERISAQQLDALGLLLRSDVLHPHAIDIVGRLGAALAAAAHEPRGSAGLRAALGALRDEHVRRSLAFLFAFARRFGAALDDGIGRPRVPGGHDQ